MKKIISLSIVLCFVFALIGCNDARIKYDVVVNKWVGEGGTLLDFKTDGSFVWFQNKDNPKDNYISGTYVFYKGQEAMDYITNDLSQFALTNEIQQKYMEADKKRILDNYYCVVLTNTLLVVDNVETVGQTFTYYMGFYIDEDKMLEFINMGTVNYAKFTLQE